MFGIHCIGMDKFAKVITDGQDVTRTMHSSSKWANEVNAQVVPWSNHRYRVELWGSLANLPTRSLANITSLHLVCEFDIEKSNINKEVVYTSCITYKTVHIFGNTWPHEPLCDAG